MTLTLIRLTVQVFSTMFLNLTFDSVQVIYVLAEMSKKFFYVNFDHFVMPVSARFFYFKIILFPIVVNKYFDGRTGIM